MNEERRGQNVLLSGRNAGSFFCPEKKMIVLAKRRNMAFFNQAVNVMGTVVVGLGGGLGVWGIINLLEGYGNDNPGANAHVQ